MLKCTTHYKGNRLERLKMCGIASIAALNTNEVVRSWGKTGDELNGCLRAMEAEMKIQKKSTTGEFYYNFQLEKTSKSIKIYHITQQGIQDELLCEINEE